MTTTATPPDPTILTTVKNDLAWVKTHLILLALVVLLTFGGVYGAESIIARHDAVAAAKYSEIAAETAKQNQLFQAQVQAQITTLVAANQQLAAQNQQLISSLAARQAKEVQIPKQTASLTTAQVATQLGGTAQGSDVLLPLPAAQVALADVQLVPLLQADKTNLQDAYNNQVQVAANNTQLYNDEHEALLSEQKAHTADNTANAAQIKKLKADCRKSKLKWFGIGVVVGFLGRGLTGI